MKDDAKKDPTPYEVSDALFAGEMKKAKQYDEIVANLVAGHKIKPNETGDFQAVLGVVANMAARPNRPTVGSWEAVQEAGEEIIRNRRPQFFGILEALNQKPNGLAIHFEELVAKLQKVGALPSGFPAPQQVVDVALAPYMAGWRANDLSGPMMVREDFVAPDAGVFALNEKAKDEALVAVREAKNGNFDKLAQLTGRPELAAPMKHIIAARKALANGRVLGGQPLAEMVADAMKDVDSFARISDTLQHYKQLRSASVVQSVKDLCDEYETMVEVLTKRGLESDRLKEMVFRGINEFDRLQQQYEDLHAQRANQPRDAADAQEIAAFMAEAYPTQNHSLPNAVRALFEIYQREVEGRKQIASMFDDEVEAQDREHWSGRTDSVDAIMWAVANVINQRNAFRADKKRLKKRLKRAGRLESTNGGAAFHLGIVDEASTLPPSIAGQTIQGGAFTSDLGDLIVDRLVNVGKMTARFRSTDHVLRAIDDLLAVEKRNREAAKGMVDLSFHLSPDALLTIPEIVERVASLAAHNEKTGSFLKTRAELLLLTKTTTNRDLLEEVRRLLTMTPTSTLHALESIREIVMTAEGEHDHYNSPDAIAQAVKRHFRKMKEGVENWHILGGILCDGKALDKKATLSFDNVKTAIGELVRKNENLNYNSSKTKEYLLACEQLIQGFGSGNLEQRIRAVVDSQFKTMGLANQLKDDVESLTKQNNSQTEALQGIGKKLSGTLVGRSYTFLNSISEGVDVLISNYMHAREAEIALEELGPEYRGTLVQKVRTAVRVVKAANDATQQGINRLEAAMIGVGAVDLGDPTSFESIEAAILNLGWDRDRHVAALRQQYIPTPRAFEDGQRVFVHYFDGYSDEYLGQQAAEIRGAKYVSATFGWFYMVEFEEAGIGAFNFDYAENRLALVPEAYLLPGDRVRLRDSQLEGAVLTLRPDTMEFAVDFDGKTGYYQSDVLIPIDQVWSIFDRKGGKNRLMVLHAPDKWEAERRAAQRLSKAGKPYVTPALIAIPGVADNAHFGGATTEVEVKVNRISGRDVNPLYSHRFAGNDVDATNARDAVLLAFTNQSRSGSEVLDKMLPKLRGASVQLTEEFEQAARFAEGAAHRAANPARKFDDGQAVTAKYKDVSSVLFDPVIRERAAVVESAAFKKGAWLYKLEGESYVFEEDLQPRALFAAGQRVIAKQVNSSGESFAKVMSSEYSDWSKKWSYEIEITAHSLKTTRWEEDLSPVPVLGHDALIQQHVETIVDREEQPATGEAPIDAPAPKYRVGQEVETGRGLMVWIITARRWPNLRSAWLYDGKAASGTGTSFGNTPEAEVRPRSGAVLSRFLAASAELQAEADKLVGKFVDVATDAKERAIRDGAINPDWLDWASGMTGKRFEIWSATVAPDGQVSFQIDNTGFRMAAKYISHV